MQAKNHDGTYDSPMPYSTDKLSELLQRKEVSHVEVFDGTPEEINRRIEFKNNLKVKKRYTKVPKHIPTAGELLVFRNADNAE